MKNIANEKVRRNKMEENWKDLGNAVIIKAVYDYRHARKVYEKNKNNYEAKSTMEEVETFLLSDHFKLFSGSSGKSLLEEIKKEDANIKKEDANIKIRRTERAGRQQ